MRIAPNTPGSIERHPEPPPGRRPPPDDEDTTLAPTHDPGAVDAYLDALPEVRRVALQRLRERVHRAAPGATERVAYGIPIIRRERDLIGFSAAARHLSLHTMSTVIGAEVRDRHPEIRGTGATIHFTEDAPLPDALIDEIVAARIEEQRAAG